MGKYDDITPERLRAELNRFARLIRRWDGQGVLLREAPSLQQFLGELRRMLFAYEVRHTTRPHPPGQEPTDESSRVVLDALQREKELHEELRRRLISPDGGEG